MDSTNLEELWNSKWGQHALVGEKLRSEFANDWIRLYTLPNGKRYPENEDEFSTIQNRLNTVIDSLNPSELFVILSIWDENVKNEIENSGLNFKYLSTINDDTSEVPRLIYINITPWTSGAINELLKNTASNEISGVIIAPKDLSWLCHPYDGGVDIILPEEEKRAQLENFKKQWVA